MPEVRICSLCRKRLDPDKDDYVVRNRTTARRKDQWDLVHEKCLRLAHELPENQRAAFIELGRKLLQAAPERRPGAPRPRRRAPRRAAKKSPQTSAQSKRKKK